MPTAAEARRLDCPLLHPRVIRDFRCLADHDLCCYWRDDGKDERGEPIGDCYYLEKERGEE